MLHSYAIRFNLGVLNTLKSDLSSLLSFSIGVILVELDSFLDIEIFLSIADR